MAAYAVPIQPLRIRLPNYDFSALGEGADAIRGWRTGRAVGEALTGNDLRGASAAAFRGGDTATGTALRRLDLDRRNIDSTIAARQATARREDARLDLNRRYADIRQREADSLALSRNRRDVLRAIRAMRGATTPQTWEAAQPLIQSVFGRSIPFSERGVVLAQARGAAGSPMGAADEFEPTERERTMGITREQKIEGARQRQLQGIYGPPKRGFKWVQRPDGTVTQELVAQSATPVNPGQQRSVGYHLNTLRNAEKTLLDSWYAWRAVGGSLNMYGVGQALQDYKQAILGIVYAQSGKQTHVREMEMWLNAYGPSPFDSDWRIKEKTKRIKSYMKAQFGIDLDALDTSTGSSQIPKTRTGGNSSGDGGSSSARTPDVQRLYDKYGLE